VNNEDEFAVMIADAVLKTSGDVIQVEVLNELAQSARAIGDLDRQIAETRKFERRPGDLGMEIVGALVIPILIEAGKQFWAIYIKKLSEKSANVLAEYTISEIRKLAERIWRGEDTLISVGKFETLVREAAAKEGLALDQTERLVTALRSRNVVDELN
jgi:hypothetical protein